MFFPLDTLIFSFIIGFKKFDYDELLDSFLKLFIYLLCLGLVNFLDLFSLSLENLSFYIIKYSFLLPHIYRNCMIFWSTTDYIHGGGPRRSNPLVMWRS